MKLNLKLKQLCERKGWRQADLLRAVGGDVSQSAMSDWFKGKFRPDLDAALRIARALDVPLDYLADDDLDQPPEPEPKAAAGGDLTADERFVLQVVRDLGIERAEAVRRLASVVLVEGEAGVGGKVQPVRQAKVLTVQNLDEQARREQREAEAEAEKKGEERRRLGFELDAECEAGQQRHVGPPPTRRR